MQEKVTDLCQLFPKIWNGLAGLVCRDWAVGVLGRFWLEVLLGAGGRGGTWERLVMEGGLLGWTNELPKALRAGWPP